MTRERIDKKRWRTLGKAVRQQARAIDATPNERNAIERALAALMLACEMRSYREARSAPGPIIFDRGIPDVVGYLRLCGLPIPAPALRAAEQRRYANRVFIAPPWPAIFEQDAERKQTLAEAEATFHAMVDVYCGLGYELVALPLVPVAERARFVREQIAA
ncbi:AAA family ATPase [Novosphingobium sp. CF614]|uniref:AAA family ATPase n=1 Tax=Novosphingobium sp. CF614 TaxID=1884364 RepID=UPI002101A947|nr:AAA family ATPase [Novosphingobium sp. CF614]